MALIGDVIVLGPFDELERARAERLQVERIFVQVGAVAEQMLGQDAERGQVVQEWTVALAERDLQRGARVDDFGLA